MKKVIEEQPELEERVDPKEVQKRVRQEKAEKRKRVKKQDRLVRWSGMILFLVLLVIGLLMWVSGEVNHNPSEADVAGKKVQTQPSGQATPQATHAGGQGRVIVE